MTITINGTNGITFPDGTVQAVGLDLYGDASISDVRATGTSYGATTASTWTKRVINTINYDNIGITLSNNEFTPSVDCWASIHLTYASTTPISFRVYNITQGTYWLYFNNVTAGNAIEQCFFNAGETYSIEYYTTSSSANLNGVAANIAGRSEYYAKLLFRRYA